MNLITSSKLASLAITIASLSACATYPVYSGGVSNGYGYPPVDIVQPAMIGVVDQPVIVQQSPVIVREAPRNRFFYNRDRDNREAYARQQRENRAREHYAREKYNREHNSNYRNDARHEARPDRVGTPRPQGQYQNRNPQAQPQMQQRRPAPAPRLTKCTAPNQSNCQK